jgi:hypothetical protein
LMPMTIRAAPAAAAFSAMSRTCRDRSSIMTA